MSEPLSSLYIRSTGGRIRFILAVELFSLRDFFLRLFREGSSLSDLIESSFNSCHVLADRHDTVELLVGNVQIVVLVMYIDMHCCET